MEGVGGEGTAGDRGVGVVAAIGCEGKGGVGEGGKGGWFLLLLGLLWWTDGDWQSVSALSQSSPPSD